MELLNPVMLWGLLAVAIPVILHLWHQKKGKLIHWAATQWLSEKKLQPSRGLKPDNLLLLVLRILMLVLLSFYVAKPLFEQSAKEKSAVKVHLIQPNKAVVSDFKFEIEEALKKGEKIIWLNEKAEEMKSFSDLPEPELKTIDLQTAFNTLILSGKIKNNQKLELYIANEPALSAISQVFVPDAFDLHSVIDSSGSARKNFLETANRQKLYINASGYLSSQSEQVFEGLAVHSGPITILINQENKIEKQTITAALRALQDVYSLDLQIDETAVPQKKYDCIFDDELPKSVDLATRYIISNAGSIPEQMIVRQPNVSYVEGGINPQTSAGIFNGELPELLGESLLDHYGLSAEDKPLSRQQLRGLFKTIKYAGNPNDSWFSKTILLLFILIFGLERWIAIRKNA